MNRLSGVHERYRQTARRQTDRQTTDGRAIAYSEREREFTFAKNRVHASTRLHAENAPVKLCNKYSKADTMFFLHLGYDILGIFMTLSNASGTLW